MVFEAEPRIWQTGAVRSRIAEVAHVKRLPFMRLKLHHACLDLATLARSGVRSGSEGLGSELEVPAYHALPQSCSMPAWVRRAL